MPILHDDVTKSQRSRHAHSRTHARTARTTRTAQHCTAQLCTALHCTHVHAHAPMPTPSCAAHDDYPKATKLRRCRNKSYSLRISEACPA
eukprot:scaffold69416_cov41-Phaeocystis_antarctica.AAC.1